jgi:hypothetical protein
MLTLMKTAAPWIASITVLAGTNSASENASRPIGRVTCVHRSKTATVLAALTSQREVVAQLVRLVRSFGQQALPNDDLGVSVVSGTLSRVSFSISCR